MSNAGVVKTGSLDEFEKQIDLHPNNQGTGESVVLMKRETPRIMEMG